MTVNRNTPRNIFEQTQNEVERQKRTQDLIQKQQMVPSIQMYNSSLFPKTKLDIGEKPIGTPGHIVRDAFTNYFGFDNPNWMWIYGDDDKWYPISVLYRARGEISYAEPPVNIPATSSVGGGVIVPIDRQYTSNPAIMDFSGYSIVIKQEGLYTANWVMFPSHIGTFSGEFDEIEMYLSMYGVPGGPIEWWVRGANNGYSGGIDFAIPPGFSTAISLKARMAPTNVSPTIWYFRDPEHYGFGNRDDFADCFLEITRLGLTNVDDLYDNPDEE